MSEDRLSIEEYLAEFVAIGRYARGLGRTEMTRFDAMLARLFEILRGVDPWEETDAIKRNAAFLRIENQAAKVVREYAKGSKAAFRTAYREVIQDANGYASAIINEQLRTNLSWTTDADLVKDKIKHRVVVGIREKEWWVKHRQNIQENFAKAMRRSVEGGRGPKHAAQYIRTQMSAYRDHVATHADTLVRSAHNEGMLITYEQQSDIVEGFQQLETLDRRTCPRCMQLDKKQWVRSDGRIKGVGHDLVFFNPPVHPNCRGVITPVIKKFKDLPKNIRDLVPEGERASVGGPVSNSIAGEDWIKTQRASALRRSFGKEKAELLVSGEIELADVVSKDNEILSLKELRRRRRKRT